MRVACALDLNLIIYAGTQNGDHQNQTLTTCQPPLSSAETPQCEFLVLLEQRGHAPAQTTTEGQCAAALCTRRWATALTRRHRHRANGNRHVVDDDYDVCKCVCVCVCLYSGRREVSVSRERRVIYDADCRINSHTHKQFIHKQRGERESKGKRMGAFYFFSTHIFCPRNLCWHCVMCLWNGSCNMFSVPFRALETVDNIVF